MLPKPSKTKPGQPPNPPKSRLGESLGVKMHSRSGPSQPRSGQEHPTTAQEAPNKRPREVKSRPRIPKSRRSGAPEKPQRGPDTSKISPDESQDEVRTGILWEALFNRRRVRFYIVFRLARQARNMLKHEKNLGKTMVFTHQEPSRIESSRSRKHLRK